MKKIPALLFLCFAFSGLLSAQTKANYNFGFEQIDGNTKLPKDWKVGVIISTGLPYESNYAPYHVDSSVKQEGKYSLLIDWQNANRDWTCSGYLINRIFKGRTIKLTGYLKTENVTGGGAGLWMRLDGYTGEAIQFDNMQDRPVKGTTDWTEYSIELPYDPTLVKHILVGALIIGKGKIWMDNFHVTVDGKDIAALETYKPKKNRKTNIFSSLLMTNILLIVIIIFLAMIYAILRKKRIQ